MSNGIDMCQHAFMEGYNAFMRGKKSSDNPHSPDGETLVVYQAWDDGYWVACDDSESEDK